MNLAEMLRIAREDQRYSAKEVAKLAEISERSYGSYERGETYPPFDKTLRLFEVLGIPYLIGEDAGVAQNVATRSNQPLPNGVRANVYVGDKCILSGILAPTDTPLEITAQVQVGEPEKVREVERVDG